MKKLFLAALVAFAPHIMSALPLSNSANPKLYAPPGMTSFEICEPFSLRLGFYGDYVFQKNLLEAVQSGEPRKFQIFTNAAEVVLNIYRSFEFFGTVGQSDMSYWGQDTDSTTYQSVNFPGLSWSAGVRWAWQWCNFTWGLEGQYFHFDTNVDYQFSLSSGTLIYLDRASRENYNEWQGGFGAAYKIQSCEYMDLIPYLGVTCLGVRMLESFDSTDQTSSFRSNRVVGLAVGATALLGQTIGLTAEGRFANETALYVSGQFRF